LKTEIGVNVGISFPKISTLNFFFETVIVKAVIRGNFFIFYFYLFIYFSVIIFLNFEKEIEWDVNISLQVFNPTHHK